jgi:hypothetical protein
MAIIHAQLIGEKAMLSRREFEQLVALAQQSEEISVEILEDEIPTANLMKLAENSGSFDFWREEGEDIYTIEDGIKL